MTVHEGDLHDRDEALAFDHGKDHLPRACGGAPAAVTDIQESGLGFAELVSVEGAQGQLTATGRFITGPLTSVFAVESDPTPTETSPGNPCGLRHGRSSGSNHNGPALTRSRSPKGPRRDRSRHTPSAHGTRREPIDSDEHPALTTIDVRHAARRGASAR